MPARNYAYNYGWISRALHWMVFLIIAIMLSLGLYFGGLDSGDQKSNLVTIHASFGLMLIVLMVSRLLWRLGNVRPLNPPDAPAWTGPAATWVHRALYFFIFAQMTVGVFILGTVDRSIPFFGLFEVPVPAPSDDDLHERLEELHELGWKIIAGLVLVHVLAAVYHHFVRRDFVLRRMMTGRPIDPPQTPPDAHSS
ncbi:cytochrome b [soil metagenome]